MGLSNVVKNISMDVMEVVKRPPQVYGIAAAAPIFTIVGGPVWIKGLFFFADEAVDNAGTGTTMEIQICGVPADSAVPTIVSTVINGICVWPLITGVVPIPNVLANPMPTILGVAANCFGQLASPGDITLAVTTASTVGMCSFYCVYYRMNPNSNIDVA